MSKSAELNRDETVQLENFLNLLVELTIIEQSGNNQIPLNDIFTLETSHNE
ncbi:MAG: hypothetical protein ACFCUV_13390 [Rivularia sp. (in: cyanobacteria)]